MPGTLFSNRARCAIVHALARQGTWKGRRHGIKLEFRLSAQANLKGERIEWKARLEKIWETGKSGTVWEALDQIETRQQSLNAWREARTFTKAPDC